MTGLAEAVAFEVAGSVFADSTDDVDSESEPTVEFTGSTTALRHDVDETDCDLAGALRITGIVKELI